jgi:hypothetical protein
MQRWPSIKARQLRGSQDSASLWKHYRAPWNERWSEVFQLIYDDAPCVEGLKTVPRMTLRLPIPWSTDEQLTASVRGGSPAPNPFTRLRSLLVQLEPLVLKIYRIFRPLNYAPSISRGRAD